MRDGSRRDMDMPSRPGRGWWAVARCGQLEPVCDGGARTLLEDVCLTSGLVDVHAHLALASSAPGGASPRERAKASGRAHLAAGVLALREQGSPDCSAVGLGPADGLPRMVSAGRFLAPQGRYSRAWPVRSGRSRWPRRQLLRLGTREAVWAGRSCLRGHLG